MRKLMYFAIGFAMACGAWVYMEDIWLQLGFLTAGGVLISFLGRDGRWWKRTAVILLGCTSGVVWYGNYHTEYLEAAIALDGQELPAAIRASDYSRESPYGITVEATTVINGKTYGVVTYLNDFDEAEPGDQFAGRFLFRTTTKDGSRENQYHQGNGIFLIAYQRGTVTLGQTQPNWKDRIAELRLQLLQTLARCIPGDAVAFAKALLLGDTADLPYEVDTDLKITGIRHVVAVSGLHISVLFALLGVSTLRKRFWMAAAGLPVLFLFAAVAGFTPSVTRACIMCALMLLGMVLNKEYDGPTALAFAVLVMLLGNPMVISSVSFQLSVASVAGIFLFRQGIKGWLLSFFPEVKGKALKTRLVHWFTGSIAVTVSAGILTTPLCAYYFGVVSLVSVLTNLLTLWVVSGVFYGLVIMCFLYSLIPSGARILGQLLVYPVRYVLWIADNLADFPLAAVYTKSVYIVAWLVLSYLLLAVFLISSNKNAVRLICCSVLSLCIALSLIWAESEREETRFTALNVGQGQCLLLQCGGRAFLVDCGGDRDTHAADAAAEMLLSQGITRLDGLILTHMDRDHAGGAEMLLSRIDTELLILPPGTRALPETAAHQCLWAEQELQIRFADATIRIFPPTFPGNNNEKSVCVLFDTEKCDILITGDRSGFGERMLLRNADIPDVDVLVAGHHGAEDSTCAELLDAVKPETVIISAGRGNPYGHPDEKLLERLTQYGCDIYRTDIHGTITIRR